ncbi:tRNA (N6-threonylcarbamoyladenosine(37)-N6)-methyltransferase TrmO [Aliikangiella coralliicola]|uniref:tRNA (N6-threonylcarbamoyladenosine(37)-N6)-methyltransferase TrmO n=1 Tax=Aliikangiella coralliicola TaxID=2592383 RepID=A0A545UHQ6_9GAMM|nr:tRNA (N6-threonylcarbamoyladenosine(37)-N6)-methyltransferase TrmO [Aliikangiella coralliicola]TQV89002.1 tRNA (N6-threonylcarbamoyladenosine(37)-N6)-methyltransferase TrmO [Aliikangiella coralliicola]
MNFSFSPIGVVHSPYKQKFAIPRQPGLVSEANGLIEMLPPCDKIEAFEGIEEFSHLWLLFIFHETMEKGWSNQVRPPRLGGNIKKGIFSTRTTFRPNPIGMSVVEFKGIRKENKKLFLELSGLDLLDQTPIIDIKPYLPYADSITGASGGFAPAKPEADMEVIFESTALKQCESFLGQYPDLITFISAVLKQDPRPGYKKKSEEEREYAVYLYDLNIRWKVIGNTNVVTTVEKKC